MPGDELCLLALDGGGVRGLSALQILRQLMAVVNPDSPPKPCEYFDMIGGTSTGGLIAIMLGRLQMTVDECIDAYVKLSDRIFQKRRHRYTLSGRIQGRFSSEELEKAIKAIIAERGLDSNALLMDSPDAKCKVFVCATSKETGNTVRLASYRSPRGRERLLRSTKIWEAGRATSAASSFFEPIKIGDFGECFVDGATGANNPIYEIWNEAQDMWPDGQSRSLEDRVKCLVSIGTGVPSLTPFPDGLVGVGRSLISIATETEQTAERFARDRSVLGNCGRYFRFNVQRGLENIGLEGSKQKSDIVAATDLYVESQAMFKQMQACGNSLAKRRCQDLGSYQVLFSLEGIPLVNKFVERSSEMEELEDHLLPSRQRQRRKVFVLSGLGGIGKTQLSIEFARKNHPRFSAVLWIDGRSEDTLIQSIVAIASRVPISQTADSMQAESQKLTGDYKSVVRDVMTWLSIPENQNWLLVFDNVDKDYRDPKAAPGAYDVKRYFPGADHGSILVTTRLMSLGQVGKSLRLGKVNNDQALIMFKDGYMTEFEESRESRELLRLLDGLPLAIAQASAYMRESQVSFGDYLDFYHEHWREIMGSDDTNEMPLHDYANGSIRTTWNISYQTIRRKHGAAARLLLLWACLDSKDLWYDLFTPAFQTLSPIKRTPEWFKTFASNRLAFVNAMKVLRGYSLVEETESFSSYSAHPVVHEWAWHMQGNEEQAENFWLAPTIVGLAISTLIKHINTNPRLTWQRLLPHIDRCQRCYDSAVANSQEFEIDEEADVIAVDALHSIGYHFRSETKYVEEEKIYQYVLKKYQRLLGTEHNRMMRTNLLMGSLHNQRGNLDDAEKIFRQALGTTENTNGPNYLFGSEDWITMGFLNELGILCRRKGKLESAKHIYLSLISRLEELGTHPLVLLVTLNNLGELYAAQGKFDKARLTLHRALRRVDDTLWTRCGELLKILTSIAFIDMKQGRLDEAERMLQRALGGYEDVFGTKNKMTLSTVRSLGHIYLRQGKLDQAEQMYQRALQGLEDTLGAEHFETVETARALGDLACMQRKLDEAERMYQRALKGYQEKFGTDDIEGVRITTPLTFLSLATKLNDLELDEDLKRVLDQFLYISMLSTLDIFER